MSALAMAPDAAAAQAGTGSTAMNDLPVDFMIHILARGNAAVGEHLRAWGNADTDIVFGRAGNAARITRTGWSVPEDGYQWTLGHRAVLELPRPTEPGPAEIQIQLAPHVHARRLSQQRVGVAVNGERLAPIDISDQVILALQIPATLLASQPVIELAFDLPDAARPVDLSTVPDDRVLGLSFRRLRLLSASAARAVAVVGTSETRAGPLADLMMCFESLGENCEFGLVQRRCGAEPLGLLRFASAPLPKLLAALRARFAGFGDPQNLVIALSDSGSEFMVHDRVFGLTHHAWVKPGELTPEQIHAREVRRVPFLARKLLEDLSLGEKIFVYHGMDGLSFAEATDLAAAVRSYGPGIVFWVELADAHNPPGSLVWAANGLLKGYIDRFAPGADAHDFALESWIHLCRDAALVAHGGRSALLISR